MYIQGFVVPVPEGKKDAYDKMARDAAPFFTKYGAARIVECWGDQVPHGETTDMYRAVNAEEGESVVFSWIEWPSKQVLDEAHKAIVEDEDMKPPPDMPFDGKRMVFAEFELIGEKGEGGATGYVQGYVAPTPKAKRDEFAAMCATMRDIAIDCGALRAVDSWAEVIEHGKLTDFNRAVKAEDDEAVAFGFSEWPSKEAYETGMTKMHEDSRMPPPGSVMPIDGRRLIFGGFDVLLDTDQE